jgi:hypothetical protein
MIKIDKYFKKIPLFEIVTPTNNSYSIINETISSSNTSYDFNLIMDETLTPALSQASIILDDYTTSGSNESNTSDLNDSTASSYSDPIEAVYHGQSIAICFDPALSSQDNTDNQKPIQPMIKFPKEVSNKRAFQASWYEKFKWLEYSISKDSVFCFDCRKFGSIHGRSEEQFIKNGTRLNNWGCALRLLRNHAETQTHKSSQLALQNRQIQHKKNSTIKNTIEVILTAKEKEFR